MAVRPYLDYLILVTGNSEVTENPLSRRQETSLGMDIGTKRQACRGGSGGGVDQDESNLFTMEYFGK